MLDALRNIAERRISEAIQEGRLRIEEWKGRALPLEEEGGVPPELRMAYKIMKNAGYLPPEVEIRKEIQQLEEVIAATEDEHLRLKQLKKLNVLALKLNIMRRRPLQIEEREEYFRKVVEKISVRTSAPEAAEKGKKTGPE